MAGKGSKGGFMKGKQTGGVYGATKKVKTKGLIYGPMVKPSKTQ